MPGPDRVILGKAPANTTNPFYSRSDKHGLFVSQPGANVHNCNDASLIFDTTSFGLLQSLTSGFTVIPMANTYGHDRYGLSDIAGRLNYVGNITIQTEVTASIFPAANSPMMVWINYQDVEGTHITNWPSFAITNAFTSIHGTGSVKAKTYANVSTNKIEIKFMNGQAEDLGVYWTLFKEPGATTGI